jgi:hypothetical protein
MLPARHARRTDLRGAQGKPKSGQQAFPHLRHPAEALNRHRGKGQQKVTVEHVHVHAGGQAVVGMVEWGQNLAVLAGRGLLNERGNSYSAASINSMLLR